MNPANSQETQGWESRPQTFTACGQRGSLTPGSPSHSITLHNGRAGVTGGTEPGVRLWPAIPPELPGETGPFLGRTNWRRKLGPSFKIRLFLNIKSCFHSNNTKREATGCTLPGLIPAHASHTHRKGAATVLLSQMGKLGLGEVEELSGPLMAGTQAGPPHSLLPQPLHLHASQHAQGAQVSSTCIRVPFIS